MYKPTVNRRFISLFWIRKLLLG